MQESSLPREFIDRVIQLFPNNHTAVLETFRTRRPCTFRINTIKSTSQETLSSLSSQGFEIIASPIPNSYILKNKSQRELTETKEYIFGKLYIQGLSSMIPPLVLAPQENDLVLDMCAAPGSKTTMISALMNNTGQIVANDMSKVRLFKLAANINTLGASNIKTIHLRAQDLWKKFPSTFDKVLVDVPCSLEGRFLEGNPKSFQNWSIKKIKILSEHQKHILRSAVSCAKPGATIVYSTCTLSPEENEEVIDWILDKEDVTLERISGFEEIMQHGITTWNNKEFSSEELKTARVIPTELFEAFYVAKLKKT